MADHRATKADLMIAGQLAWENELRNAWDNHEFSLYYQPIFNVKTNTLVGFEALIRWLHPACGNIAPSTFIPVAEKSDFIIPLGQWITTMACQQVHQWNRTFQSLFRISVNVSARQIAFGNLATMVDDVLRQTGLPADCLELELTEGMVFEPEDTVTSDLYHLHEQGVRLAIDDFGTGYSSFRYLSDFPIDTLKIDRSFVANITKSHKHEMITATMIVLAKKLDITCIAEGVETSQQVAFLRDKGCDVMQGYYYGYPMCATDCEHFIRKLFTTSVRHVSTM